MDRYYCNNCKLVHIRGINDCKFGNTINTNNKNNNSNYSSVSSISSISSISTIPNFNKILSYKEQN